MYANKHNNPEMIINLITVRHDQRLAGS